MKSALPARAASDLSKGNLSSKGILLRYQYLMWILPRGRIALADGLSMRAIAPLS
jgi:hypothetical protein